MEKHFAYYEELITKYLRGEATKKESEELAEWMSQDEDHKKIFIQYKTIWNESQATKIYFDRDTEWEKISRKINKIRPLDSGQFWKRFSRIAAILVVGLIIGVAIKSNFFKSANSSWVKINVPNGQMTRLTLSDGSKVWLNSESTFKYSTNFSDENRNVYLSGEAYLEIASDKSSSFTVKTSYMDVEVLGTKFNVRAYKEDNAFRTSLIEGKVALNTNDKKNNNTRLSPGDMARYNKKRKTLKVNEIPGNAEESISWVNGRYYFHNEELAEILKIASRWYDTEFIVKGKKLKNTRFTGVIKKDYPPEQLLKLIKKTEEISIKRDSNLIILEDISEKA